MNPSPALNRKYRYNSDMNKPFAVMYPWGDVGSSQWGTAEHAQRSFLGGAGEPVFSEPPQPSIKRQRRQILTTKNSKREVLEMKFTPIYSYETEDPPRLQQTDTWWSWWADKTSVRCPVAPTAGGLFDCPTPMSDRAIWVHELATRTEHPYAQVGNRRIRNLNVQRDPGNILSEMEWDEWQTFDDERWDIKPTCRRTVCFKNCTHDGESLILPMPYAAVRYNGDAKLRTANDTRFQPFGWTDANRSLSCDGEPTFLRTFHAQGGFEQYQPPNALEIITRAPDHPLPYSNTGDFNWDVLGDISAGKLFSMMRYACQPWTRSNAVINGLGLIEEARPFDMIVDVSSFRYRRYKLNFESGMTEPHPTDPQGFAGAYGSAYLIF